MDEKSILESSVESYLRRCVEARGGLCPKYIPDYKVGFPDRIVILPGLPAVWVETKRPHGGRLSAAQLVSHEQLRRLGQQVYTAWTKAQVDALLELITSE